MLSYILLNKAPSSQPKKVSAQSLHYKFHYSPIISRYEKKVSFPLA